MTVFSMLLGITFKPSAESSNPPKAGQWSWSSLAIRTSKADKPITLSDGPLELPKQWHRMVNNLSTIDETIAAKIE